MECDPEFGGLDARAAGCVEGWPSRRPQDHSLGQALQWPLRPLSAARTVELVVSTIIVHNHAYTLSMHSVSHAFRCMRDMEPLMSVNASSGNCAHQIFASCASHEPPGAKDENIPP